MKLCKFPGCDRRHNARGYCKPHYMQWLNGGSVKPLRVRNDPTPAPAFRKAEAPWTGALKDLMAGAPAPTLSVERFNQTPNSREWVPGRASEGAV